MTMDETAKPLRIGVSSCLLGENVRWNGGHQLNTFIRDVLGAVMECVPVCPEVECGLGIPREPVRQVGDPENPRLVTRKSGIDVTDRMNSWAAKRVRELEKEDLCGFIFKNKSPSSGLYKVKVYNDKGNPVNRGTGLFARAFIRAFPRIPVEEDGRLSDAGIRENFIDRIFVLRRWRDLLGREKKPRCLMEFHSRHKYHLMAHSPRHYKMMGKHVAGVTRGNLDTHFSVYEDMLMEAHALKGTVAKHVNVLHHLTGYFKKQISSDEKRELLDMIAHYRVGNVPLIVPVTLINHYVRKYDQPYLKDQVYLNPHPLELKLRNHV
jgi:uncharacterized protein YbgA (DUF1722 family)/uncharacterized protein YbbK (DUF523 family)